MVPCCCLRDGQVPGAKNSPTGYISFIQFHTLYRYFYILIIHHLFLCEGESKLGKHLIWAWCQQEKRVLLMRARGTLAGVSPAASWGRLSPQASSTGNTTELKWACQPATFQFFTISLKKPASCSASKELNVWLILQTQSRTRQREAWDKHEYLLRSKHQLWFTTLIWFPTVFLLCCPTEDRGLLPGLEDTCKSVSPQPSGTCSASPSNTYLLLLSVSCVILLQKWCF